MVVEIIPYLAGSSVIREEEFGFVSTGWCELGSRVTGVGTVGCYYMLYSLDLGGWMDRQTDRYVQR